jgi:hypothetical protein
MDDNVGATVTLTVVVAVVQAAALRVKAAITPIVRQYIANLSHFLFIKISPFR